MKKLLFILSGCLLGFVHAADVSDVRVIQNWPWSTRIGVTYKLENVQSSNPVDVTVRLYNGTAEFDAKKVLNATRGRRFGLTENGTYRLDIDPAELVSVGDLAISDFKVKLSVVPVSAFSSEVIYKIVALSTPSNVTDVTRGQILNGDYGAYETDFGRIGPEFTTSLDDVLIWTGVTNDVAYKTTHMVFRKIPAKDKTFRFMNKCNVSFTNDFYIGVFEVTQSQYAKIQAHPSGGSNETNPLYKDYRPVNRMYFTAGMRGYNIGAIWPEGGHTDVAPNCFMHIIQQRTGIVIDLPTEAMWEFACRAGTSTAFYSGKDSSHDAALEILRCRGVNCVNAGGTAPADCDLTDGPAWVGTYAPNAYGLYDMLGNVYERCLDRTWTVGTADLVDPRGSDDTSTTKRSCRGGSYKTARTSVAYGTRWAVEQSENPHDLGVRLCIYPNESL